MMLIGCDFHPSWQQVCWVDTETGETEEQQAGARAGRGGEVLPAVCGAGADRHGGDGELSVVRGDGDDAGARGVDRRCGEDPGQRGAAAEA